MTENEKPDSDGDPTLARVQQVIQTAVAGLDPADREERIAYCREHDEHGVRMFPGTGEDDLIEFRWGGRTLAIVHRDVLTAEGDDLGPVQAEFIADGVPDFVPDEWTDTHGE